MWVEYDENSLDNYKIALFELGNKLSSLFKYKPELPTTLRNAILESMKVRRPVASELLSFASYNSEQESEIVFVFPVYQQLPAASALNRFKKIKGFIVGVIDLADLFEEIFKWKNYMHTLKCGSY